MTCEYSDTCDRLATLEVTYLTPCYGEATVKVCQPHLDATIGRIFPNVVTTLRAI